MAYSKIEKTVLDMVKPIVEENECFVYDVEYVKEGTQWYLRLFIDKESGGVSLDECEAVSRAISDRLDESDLISQKYVLEVASPGIERRLRQPEHFKRYIGQVVDVGLYKPIDGGKTLSGVLAAYEDGAVTIKTAVGENTLAISDTAYIRLHFDF